MKPLPFLLAVVAAAFLPGCGESHDEHAGHSHGPAHQHEHQPPHGGTAVVLGKEAFHLEFVRDAKAGVLTCYVLDGHMENFVRIAAPTLTVRVQEAATNRSLTLSAVANAATGEKVGDSSQFEVKSDWVQRTERFSARLESVSIRGQEFKDVDFRFPEGNE